MDAGGSGSGDGRRAEELSVAFSLGKCSYNYIQAVAEAVGPRVHRYSQFLYHCIVPTVHIMHITIKDLLKIMKLSTKMQTLPTI